MVGWGEAEVRDRGWPSPPDPLPQNNLGEGEPAERREAGVRDRGSGSRDSGDDALQ